ncbi:MAG: hypothetical protein ACREJC_17240, partial [Tepidisphaeraceae bacterium]
IRPAKEGIAYLEKCLAEAERGRSIPRKQQAIRSTPTTTTSTSLATDIAASAICAVLVPHTRRQEMQARADALEAMMKATGTWPDPDCRELEKLTQNLSHPLCGKPRPSTDDPKAIPTWEYVNDQTPEPTKLTLARYVEEREHELMGTGIKHTRYGRSPGVVTIDADGA